MKKKQTQKKSKAPTKHRPVASAERPAVNKESPAPAPPGFQEEFASYVSALGRSPADMQRNSLAYIGRQMGNQTVQRVIDALGSPAPANVTQKGGQPSIQRAMSYKDAKTAIKAATVDMVGTDEDAVYRAIRECGTRYKLQRDGEVIKWLHDDLSGHELWKAQLLLEYGSEANYPWYVKEIWAATAGMGTDEKKIYTTLNKMKSKEMLKTPGLSAILKDEMSGSELASAIGYMKPQFIARHKRNVQAVKDLITEMKKSDQPLKVRNTGEWIDPAGAAKNDLFVMTPTHDSLERAHANGEDGNLAFFGADVQFPGDSATYSDDVDNQAGIKYGSRTLDGTHSGKTIRLFDPENRSKKTIIATLVHEVQHDADRHDVEEGWKEAFKSPEQSWVRYKTEFRAWWIDGDMDEHSEASGTAKNPKFDNAKQQAIFDMFYSSPSYGTWLKPNYDDNKEVGGEKFQDLIHGYKRPESINLINSTRIDDFSRALEKCGRGDKDSKKDPLKSLYAAAEQLNEEDRKYVNSKKAASLQNQLVVNLAYGPLRHVTKIMGGGSTPEWAKPIVGIELPAEVERPKDTMIA
jgi:hypothetical protein